MIEISNPHDRFFREALGRPEAARDFVRHYLPEPVVAHLDLDTLEVGRDSFVDDELRSHVSDLVFRVELRSGGGAYVYLLFEHKSHPDRWVTFQLLRYLVRLWEVARAREAARVLPPIVPVVFYHGRRPWAVPLDFASLVEGPAEFARYTPRFEYALADLSRYADDDLRGGALLRASLFALKHVFDADLPQRLPELVRLVARVASSPTPLGAVEALLRYVCAASDRVEAADVSAVLAQVLPGEGEEIMPTLAQRWIEEGREQGLQQGLREGRQEGRQQGRRENAHRAVLEVLETRFGVVPVSVTQALAQVPGEDVLSMLHKRAVSVESLEAFRADLQKALS